MSVTFYVRNDRSDDFLNVANMNAADLLALLGYETRDGLYGQARGVELRARIKAARKVPDVGKPDEVFHGVKICGREPGHMTEYLDVLEGLCRKAGYLGLIIWS